MNISYKFEKNAKIITELSKIVSDKHTEYYPELFNDFVYDDRFALFDNALKKESTYSIIAYDDNKPVGFIFFVDQILPTLFIKNNLKSFFIDSMSVVPEYQRKGIGTELIN